MVAVTALDPLPAVVPGQKQAEDALSTIAGQGILGAISVLLGVALFLSIKGWLRSKDDRLADQKEMGKALQAMNEAASKLAIESNRSGDGVKAAMESLAASHKELEKQVEDLEKQQVQLVAAMPTKR